MLLLTAAWLGGCRSATAGEDVVESVRITRPPDATEITTSTDTVGPGPPTRLAVAPEAFPAQAQDRIDRAGYSTQRARGFDRGMLMLPLAGGEPRRVPPSVRVVPRSMH
jgi:hypothetical protein